jgi:hypothetical protein
MDNNQTKNKFYFKDCALSTIATGQKAENLKELYDKLSIIHPSSIYYHFWGTRLSHQYETQEYLNDFAMWCYQHIHDQTLAERLSIIDPTEYENLEELRKELLLAIETRLDETENLSWMAKVHSFYFARSKIIIFDTPYLASELDEIVQVLPKISPSSIFYHFIDAHTRTPKGQDDFSAWLEGFSGKYDDLIQKLSGIDFYFSSLTEVQKTIVDIFFSYVKGEKK